MEKDDETNLADEWLKDLPATNEIKTFKPEDLLTCEKCGRNSPPNRPNCFYCGALLPASEWRKEVFKLNSRKLETWEKGFNVILLKQKEPLGSDDIIESANLLKIESEYLHKILEAEKFLPLARIETKAEAETIVEKLAQCSIESRIIGDEQLKVETFTRRLRGIEFFDDKLFLILFNADEIVEISCAESSLIVVGAVFERKIESTESIKRKEKGKVLDSSETGTDRMVIDIYPPNDFIGYQIESNGFDFSCLGEEKSLLAGQNMKLLAARLRNLLLNAKYDDGYLRIRAELGKIWEVEETNDIGGVNRRSFGSFKRTKTTIISNESQFRRYSRLQKQLL